jgi:hypothetical protein
MVKEFIPAVIKFLTETLPDLWASLMLAIVDVISTWFTETLPGILDEFFDGLKEGFLAALPPWLRGGVTGEEEEEEEDNKQFGGILKQTGRILAHAGEVVFNPRYPRQDLARAVNAAMAGVGGSSMSNVTVSPVLNIGNFSGGPAEMASLRSMIRDMSFDMALEFERKLASARRVESRRRE